MIQMITSVKQINFNTSTFTWMNYYSQYYGSKDEKDKEDYLPQRNSQIYHEGGGDRLSSKDK